MESVHSTVVRVERLDSEDLPDKETAAFVVLKGTTAYRITVNRTSGGRVREWSQVLPLSDEFVRTEDADAFSIAEKLVVQRAERAWREDGQ